MQLKVVIPQFWSILLYSSSGLCIFLMLLNRLLMLRPDGTAKRVAIFLSFIAITGGSVAAGFKFPHFPWVLFPASILGLVIVGEVHRSLLRRSCAGSSSNRNILNRTTLSNPVTTTDVTVHKFEVHHPNWSGPRLRVVHITDLHIARGLSAEYYERVLRLAEEQEPDLAVFTGDFITRLGFLPLVRRLLRPMAGAETFAVLGNHDYWTDPKAVASVLKEAGLRLLTNESESINIHGGDILVTGYDYPWYDNGFVLSANPKDVLHLVLTHTPDNIYRLLKASPDFVFSGHYHAGQVRLPFLGPVVIPSVYGRRFDHGHFIVNGTHLFVAGGIGVSNPPIRLFCRPDIFVVDILAGN